MSTTGGAAYPFVCGLCNDAFQTITSYYIHFKSHDTVINQSFHICDEPSAAMDSCADMMLSCQSCCGTFRNICLLHDHLLDGSKDGSYIYDDVKKTAYPRSRLCAFSIARSDEVPDSNSHKREQTTESDTDIVMTTHSRLCDRKNTCKQVKCTDRKQRSAKNISGKAIVDASINSADLLKKTLSVCAKETNRDVFHKKDSKRRKMQGTERRSDETVNSHPVDVSRNRQNIRRSCRQNGHLRFNKNTDDNACEISSEIHSTKNESKKAAMKRNSNTADNISISCRLETADIKTESSKIVKCDSELNDIKSYIGSVEAVISDDIKSGCDSDMENCDESDPIDVDSECPADEKDVEAAREVGTVYESITSEEEGPGTKLDHNTKVIKNMRKMKTLKSQMKKQTNKAAFIYKSNDDTIEHSENNQQNKCGKKKQILVTCEICGKKIPQNKVKVHAISHSDDRPHKCPHCPKTYKYPEHLTMHLKSHNDVLPYYCEVCGQGFVDVNRLKRHAFMHTSDRPYQCNVCEAGFVTRYKLERHMAVHTREKKMQCDLCGMRFAHKESLNQHISGIHRKEHRFPCPDCNKTFFTNYQLKCHAMKHSGLRPFKCSQCKSDFIERKELRRHMRKQHKLNLDGKSIESGEATENAEPNTTEEESKSENQSGKGMSLLPPRLGLSNFPANLEQEFNPMTNQFNDRLQHKLNEGNTQSDMNITTTDAVPSAAQTEVGSHFNVDDSSVRMYEKDKQGTRPFDSHQKPLSFDAQVDLYPGSYPPYINQKVPAVYPGPCLSHQPPQLYLPVYPAQLRPPGYEVMEASSQCKDMPMYTMPGMRPVGVVCDMPQQGGIKEETSYLDSQGGVSVPHSQDQSGGSHFTML